MSSIRVEFQHFQESRERNWPPRALVSHFDGFFVTCIPALSIERLTREEENMLEPAQKQLNTARFLVEFLFVRGWFCQTPDSVPISIVFGCDWFSGLANRATRYGNTTRPNSIRWLICILHTQTGGRNVVVQYSLSSRCYLGSVVFIFMLLLFSQIIS